MADTATADTLGPSLIDTAPSVGAQPSAPKSLLRFQQPLAAGAGLCRRHHHLGAVALLHAASGIDPYQPVFIILLVAACLISAFKVTLPLPVANGSTLSMADAANVMSMLLLVHRLRQLWPLQASGCSARSGRSSVIRSTGRCSAWPRRR